MKRELEKIKLLISQENCQYVSFDIFDTLLLRPFWEPYDLFFFVGVFAVELNVVQNSFDFIKIRRDAELNARKQLNEELQDITLDMIYLKVMQTLSIDLIKADMLKNREIELELKFCYKRQSAYELYEYALRINKNVICISDMYLPEDVINKLLIENGYQNIVKTYVSSNIKLSKCTGDMFQYVIRDLGIKKPNQILHIGDNLESDFKMAKKWGLMSSYLPKAKDKYCRKHRVKVKLRLLDRCLLAIKANQQWDNPFELNKRETVEMILDSKLKDYIFLLKQSSDMFVMSSGRNMIIRRVLGKIKRKNIVGNIR